ncbi:hypothetical protein Taro_042112 [Colocasia esculenta]|uniref:Plastid lipid-associated protein/fibrillin conserved domain-containing protein n=1 Tax=Colocasia esculenta TaxID=4460 RepID=A0A843WXQ2_COLES|nr:hypothetical protein [Colocasia esculenta]
MRRYKAALRLRSAGIAAELRLLRGPTGSVLPAQRRGGARVLCIWLPTGGALTAAPSTCSSLLDSHARAVRRRCNDIRLPRTVSVQKGISSVLSKQTMFGSSSISSGLLWKSKHSSLGQKYHTCRFSTKSDVSDDLIIDEDLLHFIRSAFDMHEDIHYFKYLVSSLAVQFVLLLLEMSNVPCYLLLKDFTSSLIHREWDVDLEVIVKDLEEFDLSWGGDAATVKESSNNKANHAEGIEEPCDCSPLRNLLLYYPSCISADDCGNHIFLSDTNHHRIIVTDGDGEIIDCIGSSPGFEDGEFDSAKLLRPTGSVYDDGEDCLYFVDSENHAIRRAHMGRRVLETLYPVHDKKSSGIWSWILDKFSVGRKFRTESRELEEDSLSHPWHLMKSGEDDLLVINRSFETLWVMSMASGEVKEVCKGFPNIMEIHGQIIMERASLLEEISTHVLWESTVSNFSPQKLPYAGFMSSISNLHNNIIFCDPMRQRVFKCQRGSTDLTSIQFTNIGLLGMPYWMACPLENVLFRCDIRVNVQIPEYAALAAPLHKDCIWRQARGAAAEVSSPEVAASVGVAQRWFDELDNLAFSQPHTDSSMKEEDKHPVVLDANIVHIDCAVNLSPGTSEVVISAVLYLKLHKTGDSLGNQVRENMKRLLDLQEKLQDDACIELLESSGDVRDIVFMKPLHLRIRLDCGDHPAARTSKEVIPTDSILDVARPLLSDEWSFVLTATGNCDGGPSQDVRLWLLLTGYTSSSSSFFLLAPHLSLCSSSCVIPVFAVPQQQQQQQQLRARCRRGNMSAAARFLHLPPPSGQGLRSTHGNPTTSSPPGFTGFWARRRPSSSPRYAPPPAPAMRARSGGDGADAEGTAVAAASGGGADYRTAGEVKAALLQSLQGIDRGIFGVQSQRRSEIEGLVRSLESRNPTSDPTDHLDQVDGCWKLLYSTITILGSKRTKLGLRDFVSLGEFFQNIDVAQGKAINEIKFNVRGFKMLSGQLTIVASFTIASKSRVDIKFESSDISPEQLMNLFQRNHDLLLAIFNPEGWLEITYVDESIRIGRDDKGNIFILERTSEEKGS